MPDLSEAPTHQFSPLWAVHSEQDARPSFRGWARSETEAKARLEAIRGNDVDAASTQYWVVQMTTSEVAGLKSIGVLPSDA